MVCVGNICRSPMAEALFRHRLEQRGIKASVQSAGIGALVGRGADPLSQTLMQERGLDLSAHRARQITRELLSGFELVIVMEDGHRKAIEQMNPAARGRVRTLGAMGKFDVPDPYGKGRQDFEQALALIDRGLADYERMLWS